MTTKFKKVDKEKVKEAINKNTGIIATGLVLGGAYVLGYKTGVKITGLQIDNALYKVGKFEPDLIPTLERGIEAFKNSK